MSNKIEYISYEELLNVYAKTIANSGGGLSGIRDDGGIQSLLQFVQDDEYYPDFVDKLTYLVYGFCHGHYYLDGNKRISLTVGVYFLIKNGYYFLASNFMKEVEALIYHVAAGNIDRDLLKRALRCVVNDVDYDEELKLDIISAMSKGLPFCD
jgi:death-on-curing protein